MLKLNTIIFCHKFLGTDLGIKLLTVLTLLRSIKTIKHLKENQKNLQNKNNDSFFYCTIILCVCVYH